MKPGRTNRTDTRRSRGGFEELAREKSPNLAAEFLDFLLHNKKWWLAPIIAFLLLLGLVAVLGGTGAAPFIYTLF